MEKVILEKEENGIVTLTINRPKALNAINKDVMEGLNAWFNEGYKVYEGLKGVIITGAGEKAFVAGADIKQFTEVTEEGSNLSKYGHETYFSIERFHVPVIAAVNGFALGGGCELAMACHLRVAAKEAKFGQPEVNLGLIPGYGGTQRLVQLIGKGRAMYLLLTADMIDAETALEYGLVNQIVDKGDLLATCIAILEKIGGKGPQAVAKSIELVNAYFDNNTDGFQKEWEAFDKMLITEECKEGVQAFIEKRKATFKR